MKLSHEYFISNSQFRAYWDLVTIFAILFEGCSIPFLIAFFDDERIVVSDLIAFAMNGVIELFFLANIYLRDQKFTYVDNGRTVIKKDQIKSHYRSNYLLLDVLAILPLDALVVCQLVTRATLPFLALLKLLRMFRLPGLFIIIDRYISKFRLQISFASTKLVHAFIYLVMVNHWYVAHNRFSI